MNELSEEMYAFDSDISRLLLQQGKSVEEVAFALKAHTADAAAASTFSSQLHLRT
jgi:hypothetical protein